MGCGIEAVGYHKISALLQSVFGSIELQQTHCVNQTAYSRHQIVCPHIANKRVGKGRQVHIFSEPVYRVVFKRFRNRQFSCAVSLRYQINIKLRPC